MQGKKLVILISGTPGTGKTTVADILKDKFSALSINLTDVAIANDFILESDAQRQTKVANLEKLIPYMENLISSHSNNIVIEGHYADVIPDSLISVFIILRTEPHILKQRLIKKQFPPQKVQENLQSEILGACTSAALDNHDRNKIYEVDTSTASLEEIIEKTLILIEERPPSNVGRINWMQKLEDNELLKYF